ncbi:ribonuclease P protein component [Pontibacter arcticus]|uniref:Ribonuclease P protein component n=1 Tax=Pontibacter arcticus TaxID=2080288 RepID=A0A364RAT3_9BACT|nr:ribonuclease P protein component [Pontibacter arcticus]RAU81451.1 ribonuclease P protein component [Pontibacter arcticus]
MQHVELVNDANAEQPLHTFPKEERLCSKRFISLLFTKGSSFNVYPLRFIFFASEDVPPGHTQVLISVSKRYFKRATDRNRLKRQMREAYRLNKHFFAQHPGQAPALLGILYIGKEKKSFHSIQKKLISGLERCLIK